MPRTSPVLIIERDDEAARHIEAILSYLEMTSLVVDPEGVLALDIHPNNNSRFRETPTKKGAVKWASLWMVWVQDLLSSWAFYI